jgi:hypothetical protein
VRPSQDFRPEGGVIEGDTMGMWDKRGGWKWHVACKRPQESVFSEDLILLTPTVLPP